MTVDVQLTSSKSRQTLRERGTVTASLRTFQRGQTDNGLPLLISDVYYIQVVKSINPREGDHGRGSRLARGNCRGKNQTDPNRYR